MNYVFRQHYTWQTPSSDVTLNRGDRNFPTVLLVEAEPEALALYAGHLTKANLLVNVCLELSDVLRQISETQPHLLIVNPSRDLNQALAVLSQVTRLEPGLPIITVGGTIPDPYLDRLMATGVALHLNRLLTQPRDIAIAARQILGLN